MAYSGRTVMDLNRRFISILLACIELFWSGFFMRRGAAIATSQYRAPRRAVGVRRGTAGRDRFLRVTAMTAPDHEHPAAQRTAPRHKA
jgi:hypothetical protein